MRLPSAISFFFFFNDTATTEIYTLSLHDALPISHERYDTDRVVVPKVRNEDDYLGIATWGEALDAIRSEEHTSELQSQSNLVCRLLLEKKKKQRKLHSSDDEPSAPRRARAVCTTL